MADEPENPRFILSLSPWHYFPKAYSSSAFSHGFSRLPPAAPQRAFPLRRPRPPQLFLFSFLRRPKILAPLYTFLWQSRRASSSQAGLDYFQFTAFPAEKQGFPWDFS
ncbi:MAG: hypothetical protein ACLRXC_10900 [[Clostridium] leptum]